MVNLRVNLLAYFESKLEVFIAHFNNSFKHAIYKQVLSQKLIIKCLTFGKFFISQLLQSLTKKHAILPHSYFKAGQ